MNCTPFPRQTYVLVAGSRSADAAAFDAASRAAPASSSSSSTPSSAAAAAEWIVKPSSLNRGRGIQVFPSGAAAAAHVARQERGSEWVVQRYIASPMLVRGRKFDIRQLVLFTPQGQARCGGRGRRAAASPRHTLSFAQSKQDDKRARNTASHPPTPHSLPTPYPPLTHSLPSTQVFMYRDSYVRTCSAEFSAEGDDLSVHLTNDAVQKHLGTYGQFEDANKLSFPELDVRRERPAWTPGPACGCVRPGDESPPVARSGWAEGRARILPAPRDAAGGAAGAGGQGGGPRGDRGPAHLAGARMRWGLPSPAT